MFLSEWSEFPSAPCLAGKKYLMTSRISMLLKPRASLTCFRACFLPGQVKDLSAPRVMTELAQANIRLPLTTECRVRIQASLLEVCDALSGSGGGMFSSVSPVSIAPPILHYYPRIFTLTSLKTDNAVT